ncbi:hypothetical protein AXF42_Ash010590 [Apostasia shenzhenica]|uniref:Uncharacterized protein n=1 Tax=Apostasia shenzhenica TaxID=1088818 RepID=A0A2I0A6I2_9ASPA|nr:hypothetical protein AXF42_Ash010590 [Apostasia shenzhenica]
MASTGATPRHLQLLVLLLICASTSTTAAPIKLPFDLPDDSKWHSMLDMPMGKEFGLLLCKDAVEAYNSKNPKGRLNGCQSVYSAKAMIHDGRVAFRFQLKSSKRRWFGKDEDVVADILVNISLDGEPDSWVESVVVLGVQRDYGL